MATPQLTVKLLLKRSNRSLKKGEKVEDALRTITHLHMYELGLKHFEDLSHFTSAMCVYAYDNQLEDLNGIECLDNLQELQAQNNKIAEIPMLQPFSLRKLDLRHNLIKCIKGLDHQIDLQELYLSGQSAGPVELPPDCLAPCADTLDKLEMAECGISHLSALYPLTRLRFLNLANNNITDFKEIEDLFAHLQNLESVNFSGNPVTSLPRYREKTIILGQFHELDEKEVLDTQRETYLRMALRKKKSGKATPAPGQTNPTEAIRVHHINTK